MANAARIRSARPLLVLAAALITLAATSAAGASRHTSATHSVSNSLSALKTAPYTLVGLDRAHGRRAVPALRAAGAVELSHRLAIWRLPSGKALKVIPGLQAGGLLRAFQPDLVLTPAANPFKGPDTMLKYQWWLAKVGADRAPDPPGPGKPVTVIDDGADPMLPDFLGKKNYTPLNWGGPTGDLIGTHVVSHGVKVATVIGAPNDDKGVVGIYPEANLYQWDAARSGALTLSSVITGLDRAGRLGPGIVNLSLGNELREPLEEDIVLDAFDRGLIVVAAAGNSRGNGSPNTFPANYEHVLTVGAIDDRDKATDFSTQSRGIDLAAPGIGVLVPVSYDIAPDLTITTTYDGGDGTSFSAPIVSGAAAWLWSARPELDKTQVIELLRSTARDVGTTGRDIDTGFGVLDIAAALAAPAPSVDPSEPNDDVDQVTADGIFGHAKPAMNLTNPATLTARLDSSEDPVDVYRVWVKRGQRVTATLTSGTLNSATQLDLGLWHPDTESVLVRGWQRRNDIASAASWKGTGTATAAATNDSAGGGYYYLAVSIPTTAALGSGSYTVSVTTSAAPAKKTTPKPKHK